METFLDIFFMFFVFPFGLCLLVNEIYIRVKVRKYKEFFISIREIGSDRNLLLNTLFFPLQDVKKGMMFMPDMREDKDFNSLLRRIKVQKTLWIILLCIGAIVSLSELIALSFE